MFSQRFDEYLEHALGERLAGRIVFHTRGRHLALLEHDIVSTIYSGRMDWATGVWG